MRVIDLINILQREDVNKNSLVYLNFNQFKAFYIMKIDGEDIVLFTDNPEEIDKVIKGKSNER